MRTFRLLPALMISILPVVAVAQSRPAKQPASRPAARLTDKQLIREATGISLSTLGADLRRRMRGEKDRKGLLIGKVDSSTPAFRAGLRKGDVLLSWGEKPVASVAELAKWIRKGDGDVVEVRYRRKSKALVTRKVKWKERDVKLELGQPGIRMAFGMTFSRIRSIIRRNLIRTDTPYGFQIKRVDAGSLAAKAGLRKGDIVLRWNGKPLYELEQVRKWLGDEKRADSVEVLYSRRRKDAKLLDRRPWQQGKLVLKLPRKKK